VSASREASGIPIAERATRLSPADRLARRRRRSTTRRDARPISVDLPANAPI
jgi:hypothetical protein